MIVSEQFVEGRVANNLEKFIQKGDANDVLLNGSPDTLKMTPDKIVESRVGKTPEKVSEKLEGTITIKIGEKPKRGQLIDCHEVFGKREKLTNTLPATPAAPTCGTGSSRVWRSSRQHANENG